MIFSTFEYKQWQSLKQIILVIVTVSVVDSNIAPFVIFFRMVI